MIKKARSYQNEICFYLMVLSDADQVARCAGCEEEFYTESINPAPFIKTIFYQHVVPLGLGITMKNIFLKLLSRFVANTLIESRKLPTSTCEASRTFEDVHYLKSKPC